MTEFWKSNKMHWCDVCKCWMNDSKAAIAHHEQGMGHKANLARKLRDMSKKADNEKKEKAQLETAMTRIEKEAKTKFEADQAEAARLSAAAAQSELERMENWEWDEGAAYYYNEKYRWYYDPKTKWYYGGEPAPDWSEKPPIPSYALFGMAPHKGGPVPQLAPSAAASKPSTPLSGPSSAAGPAVKTVVTQKVVLEIPKHPQMTIGGHQAMDVRVGRVGAAKGVTGVAGVGTATTAAAAGKPGGDKRKREESLSAEEQAARAKREAARARVAARTAQNFGFM